MNKYFNFKALEEFQKLDIDQLDSISGGRRLTKAEMDDCTATAVKSADKKRKLIKQGRFSEASALEDNFYKLYMEWLNDISSAPVDSEEVLFSEIFEPYL
jgi:hypothetical protein